MIKLELIGPVNVYFGMGIQILTACALGGLIGLDREKKMKSAGIKTNILICIGSTLYTSISLLNLSDAGQVADPNRIAAQIVSGIGFLGAGAIIQGKGGVVGMTTAATIWVVAAIGVTIGSGYPIIASIFTITSLVVLKILGPLYKLFENEDNFRTYRVEVLSIGSVRDMVEELVFSEVEKIFDLKEEIVDTKDNRRMLTFILNYHPKKVPELVKDIKSVLQVEKVSSHKIDLG